VPDVVEVDSKGRVVVSYTNQLQSTTRHKFNGPRRLSVDKNNEFILVADKDNNRIVILNRSLNSCARELNVMSVDGGLQEPYCLHFDTSQNRLLVGEYSGRVLIFDNVI
jgi:6-phosphogluconolactonase (cycloisomerase 2 family)